MYTRLAMSQPTKLSRRQSASILFCLLLALAACNTTTPAPGLSGRDLSKIICQPSDLASGFHPSSAQSSPPEGEAEDVVAYYSVLFDENQTAYQSLFCSISVYKDVAAAQSAFQTLCDQSGLILASPAAVGEESCDTGPTGVVSLAFRRGTALVFIQADSYGFGVSKAASMVDGRLK